MLAEKKDICFTMSENARKMGIERFDREQTYSAIAEVLAVSMVSK